MSKKYKEEYNMLKSEKQEILSKIMMLLSELIETDDTASDTLNTQTTVQNKVELITIKEASQIISGLSEHTIRQLIRQNKIKYIRTGQGKKGKILIYKDNLINYFVKSA